VADFNDLGRRLRVRAYQVGRWSHATPRKATKVLVSSLIRSTPVDEGVARSNWQVATGASRAKVRPAFSPGKRLGLGETRNAAAAIADAFARIDRAPTVGFLQAFLNAGVAEAAGGTSFYVSNPVYYIEALDQGHSKQQAAGWVRRAIDQARIAVRRNKIFDDFGRS
jgi:hypothetical protein